jgi:DedD protein
MEQTLKQRLIGAIVLVSLAVIFIPIILEGPDDEWTPRSHSIPQQPQMDYRADMELELPPETSVVEETVAVEEAVSAEQLEPDTEQVESEPARDIVSPAAPEKAPEPVKTAPEPAAPPVVKAAVPAVPDTPVLKGWFVQVGSFGQEMNASGLGERLTAAGYQVQLQTVELGKKHAYRVLIGPSTSRAEAEKRAAKLKSGQQLKGMVIEYPG